MLVSILTSLCLVLLQFSRNSTAWPLQSASAAGTLGKVLANLLALAGLASVFYGAACSEKPPSSLHALLWRNLEINSVEDCSASFLGGWEECLAFNAHGVENVSPLCVRALAQGALLALLAVLACCFHRLWLKTLLLLGFLSYFSLNAAIELQAEQRAAIKIFSLDPTFAFANESIFVRTL